MPVTSNAKEKSIFMYIQNMKDRKYFLEQYDKRFNK